VSDNDMDNTSSALDQETKSHGISYTVTDAISVSYGEEKISRDGKSSDIEVEGMTGSYTSGGMTVALSSIEASNVDHSNSGVDNDNEFWKVSLSFAF
jgi:outer membrane protein OmpU